LKTTEIYTFNPKNFPKNPQAPPRSSKFIQVFSKILQDPPKIPYLPPKFLQMTQKIAKVSTKTTHSEEFSYIFMTLSELLRIIGHNFTEKIKKSLKK
jgi:hypothetical protein